MNFWLNNFYCKYKEECTNVLKNYQFEVLNNELKVSLIKDNIVDIIDAIDKNDVIREANAIRKDYFEGYRNYFNENLIVTYSLALQIIQKKNDIIVKQKEYEEIKEKAQKIIRDYNKGYLFYYNRGYFDSLFDFDMNRDIARVEITKEGTRTVTSKTDIYSYTASSPPLLSPGHRLYFSALLAIRCRYMTGFEPKKQNLLQAILFSLPTGWKQNLSRP